MPPGGRGRVSSDRMPDLPERVRLVIFDLDGVVYRGAQAIPGAAELVTWLHHSGVKVRFATNNSMVAREGYVERLRLMGIETTAEEIVTSSSATVEHLHRHAPEVRRVMAIGADGLRDELSEAGFDTTMAGDVAAAVPGGALSESYDALIVGLDPAFDYARLASGMSAVAGGARLIATNADARYPTPTGFVPGAGSIVASLEVATGVAAEVIGKPEPAMFRAIIEASGVPAAETVVVGDNPASDIVGASRAGCASILVLTGVADAAGVATLVDDAAPHAVADDPAGVRALLEPLVS